MRRITIYQELQNFPDQFITSLKLVERIDFSSIQGRKLRHFVYAGMGGSSLPADLINDTQLGRVRFNIVRDYQLPPDTHSEDLVICASYSGNTEETLAVFQHAQKLGCLLVAMSHGGILKEQAKHQNIPFIPIPSCIQPRCATGYFFASVLALLNRLGQLESPKDDLSQLTKFLHRHQSSIEKRGKDLALQLKGRIPIIYGPTMLQGVCRIWKIKFNENSKVQSFYNVFPEFNHNEMVGYTQLQMQPVIIYLKTPEMHPRVLKRMEVMKELLEDKIPFFEVECEGKNLLEATFENILIGDYASYNLALLYGIDPTPVSMVEDFKARMSG